MNNQSNQQSQPQQSQQQYQQYAEQLVRMNQNPFNIQEIQEAKQCTASIVTKLLQLKDQTSDPDVRKQASKAIIDFESAIGYVDNAWGRHAVNQQTQQSQSSARNQEQQGNGQQQASRSLLQNTF